MSWYQDIVIWLILGAIALLGLFFAAIVVVVRLERRRVRKLVPLSDAEGPVARSGDAAELAREAERIGFNYFGAFRDEESNLLKVRVDLYLSDDGLVVLIITSMKACLGYRLASRMADDVWLFTADVTGDVDLSGLRLTEMLPGCTLRQVLAYHNDRIVAYACAAVPFDPDSLVGDLYEHEHMRARRAVELGHARWVSEQRRVYTSTWRCALKHCTDLARPWRQLTGANERAE